MNATRIVYEDAGWRNLLPLVYWRSVGELRCGRRLLLETAEPTGLWVRPELAAVTAARCPHLSVNQPTGDDPPGPNGRPDAASVLLLNARWLAEAPPPIDGPPAVGVSGGQVAYLRLTAAQAADLDAEAMLDPDAPTAEAWAARLGRRESADGAMVRYPWDLVHHNKARLESDWRRGGEPQLLGMIYPGVHLLERPNIHVGAASVVKPCTVLDAESGPIWIGENVRISPHCTIQGPVAICDGTLIQPGAVIREGTTVGPVCKVGGEVEESIIWGYSNKQHDGFLGHACLGAWINIAADSINSDLKNTYGPVRVPINGVEVDSGQMFVGLTMGDHSKSGINSSFATGTVVGFCCNVICNAFPPKFVPSFCWMTDACRKHYDPRRGLAVARAVMARRKIEMTAAEEELFLTIADRCRQIEVAGALEPAEA